MNLPQTNSPVFDALRRITKARQILEEVVISSESFDYRKAKQGLNDLQRIIRELGREEARLRAGDGLDEETGARVVPFPRSDTERQRPAS
jgi:hypothetical protein